MQHIKQTILTLVALIAVTTGAWAETGENIFQYCYDCQRSPAYPKTTASASLSGFANPYVGYNGIGRGMDNTSAGPWKLEYMGLWSTTDKHEIDYVSNYQSTYNCTDVPVFRLYQWNATANEYQHAAYGVVCCYAKVSNAVEHTALFVAQGGWGCVLTNSSHSSSMNITFDEDLSTGLTTLIAAATPNASSGTAFDVDWNKTSKTGTFTMPGGNVELEPEYYPQAALTAAPTAINDVPATTDGAIVKAGTVATITGTTNAQGTVMYYAVQSATAPTAPDYDATGWTDKVPTATDFAEGNVYVWYYIKGIDAAEGVTPTAENTFNDSEICETPIKVTVLSNKFDIQFNAANANTIEAGKATVTVGGTAATVTEGKLEGVKMGSEVKVTAKEGYKFRKVEVKKAATAGPATAQINVPDTWKDDNTKVTASDFPGLVALTDDEAAAIACPDAVGNVRVIYRLEEDGYLRVILFTDGQKQGQPFTISRTHKGLYDDFNYSTPTKYYYTTGK